MSINYSSDRELTAIRVSSRSSDQFRRSVRLRFSLGHSNVPGCRRRHVNTGGELLNTPGASTSHRGGAGQRGAGCLGQHRGCGFNFQGEMGLKKRKMFGPPFCGMIVLYYRPRGGPLTIFLVRQRPRNIFRIPQNSTK